MLLKPSIRKVLWIWRFYLHKSIRNWQNQKRHPSLPDNQPLYEKEKIAMDQFYMWQIRHESFHLQQTELHLGDANDKFFFNKLKRKRYNNIIASTLGDGEEWV